MDDKDNIHRIQHMSVQEKEEIMKYSAAIKSLQSEVLSLQEKNSYLKNVFEEVAEKEAMYKHFTLDIIHQAFDALNAKNAEIKKEFHCSKDTVTNDFETVFQGLDELCDFCRVETNITNDVLQGKVKNIIERNCAFRIKLDDCENQIADLLVKKNKLDVENVNIENEVIELRNSLFKKNKEFSELQDQLANSKDEAIMMRKEMEEFQEKLKKLKEMDQSLKARNEEQANKIIQAQTASKNLSKCLKKKATDFELLQKKIDTIEKQLLHEEGFKSTKDSLKCCMKKTKVITAEIDDLTAKLHSSDVEQQYHLDLQNAQSILAQIAFEREMLFQKRNRVEPELLEIFHFYYKEIQNVYKKLMALYGKSTISHCNQLESLDNFVDEPFKEGFKIVVSPKKERFEEKDLNNEPFQKRAKCNGGNHVLLENEKIEPIPVNENSANGLLEMDPLQVEENPPDDLCENKSEYLELTSNCDGGDNQPV